ncbi:hypothetical protein M2283_010200, partial [Streptomyces pseudovenezuelae]|nr:hypothetical protein [Streptomyces pseudovenezuelae]
MEIGRRPFSITPPPEAGNPRGDARNEPSASIRLPEAERSG